MPWLAAPWRVLSAPSRARICPRLTCSAWAPGGGVESAWAVPWAGWRGVHRPGHSSVPSGPQHRSKCCLVPGCVGVQGLFFSTPIPLGTPTPLAAPPWLLAPRDRRVPVPAGTGSTVPAGGLQGRTRLLRVPWCSPQRGPGPGTYLPPFSGCRSCFLPSLPCLHTEQRGAISWGDQLRAMGQGTQAPAGEKGAHLGPPSPAGGRLWAREGHPSLPCEAWAVLPGGCRLPGCELAASAPPPCTPAGGSGGLGEQPPLGPEQAGEARGAPLASCAIGTSRTLQVRAEPLPGKWIKITPTVSGVANLRAP